MGVKMTTTTREIDNYLRDRMKRIDRSIIRMLQFLGEKCLIEARDRSQSESWNDQTGNLRSSIGYVIVADGVIVTTSSFGQVKDGAEGILEGQKLALDLATRHKTGYALIVVAGMNYAEYVEAMDNKVVLVSAELLANRELPIMMKRLENQMAT